MGSQLRQISPCRAVGRKCLAGRLERLMCLKLALHKSTEQLSQTDTGGLVEPRRPQNRRDTAVIGNHLLLQLYLPTLFWSPLTDAFIPYPYFPWLLNRGAKRNSSNAERMAQCRKFDTSFDTLGRKVPCQDIQYAVRKINVSTRQHEKPCQFSSALPHDDAMHHLSLAHFTLL